MCKKIFWKVGIFLVFLALLLAALVTPIASKQEKRSIEVIFHDIKIRVKGALVPTKGEDEPFIYEGRVYVPLPFIAEALGQEARWDPTSWTVVIGETGATYLSDLKPYRATMGIWYDVDANMWMGGKRYFKGFKTDWGEFDFNLNGQYTKLTGLLGVDDEAPEGTYTITFLGDGRQIGNFEFSKGDLPKPVSLDVSGVLRLTIKVRGPDWCRVDFTDALLE